MSDLSPLNIARTRSFSMSKTKFSPISKSCPYTNLREIGLKMSREITCSSVRPHLLAPVYTAVFRGKEAAFWLRSLSQRDLDTIVDDDDNNNNNNNKNNNNNNHDNDDDSIDNNEINGNGNSMDILNWMLREKLIFHVTGTSKNLLSKIPNPINQIKIAGRKTPVKKNVSIKPMGTHKSAKSSSSPGTTLAPSSSSKNNGKSSLSSSSAAAGLSISSSSTTSVTTPSTVGLTQSNVVNVDKLKFIDSSKALYRFNDALIADRHVHVIVHYAQSLIGKSKDGTSSPFVRLELGRQRAETKVVSKDLNAKWEEHFTFGMVEREERTSSLRISVWDSHVGRSAFLGQVSVYIRSNGEVRVPVIEETDGRGYATADACPPSTRLKLQKRSVKSRVGGYIYVTTYVTNYNFSPHLRIRSSITNKNYFESDPVFMKQAMRETFGCVLSREEMGEQAALAAASASGYWDLVIRLKGFDQVQLKGEVRDLKIASALLLPGMQWKNRVVAKIRWGKHQQTELESSWILRKNGRWKSHKNSMRLSHLLHEDIRQGQIEMDLVMRDTWAAEWDKNARILGTTATFTLEELPRIIGKAAEDSLVNDVFDNDDEEDAGNRNKDENNNLSPMRRSSSGSSNNSTTNDSGNIYDDLTTSSKKNNGTSNSMNNNNTNNNNTTNTDGNEFLQEFPLFIRTHAGKKHRIRNGTLHAAVYLVPSNISGSLDNSFKDDLSLLQLENKKVLLLKKPNDIVAGLKHKILDIIVDTSFLTLKRYLFSSNPSFLISFYTSFGYRSINIGPWELQEDEADLTQPTPPPRSNKNKNKLIGMSRKVSFLLPDGRAVSRNQTVEAQKVIADEKNILVVEVQNITQEMPLYGLYKAKWQIAIIFDRARFTRLRVTADLTWTGKVNWPKKTQQAVENGFIGGCRDKFDSLVKFLDWSSNRRWTLSSDKDENGNGREGTQQSFMKLFLRPGSSCVGNVFFHCSWFVMLMIGIFWWYIF